jgi:hypothetical protein
MGQQDGTKVRRRLTVLTERQHEVLAGMLQGLTHRQIARELKLSTLAVQKYMVTIWDRLCMQENRQYALALLNAFRNRHGPQAGEMVEFRDLAVGQPFRHGSVTFQRIERSRDSLGPFNALSGTDRALFYEKMLVEVVE